MKTKLTGLFVAVCLVIGICFTGCAEQVALAGLEVQGSVPILAVGSSAPVQLQYSFSREAPSKEEIAAALEQVTLVWASSDETVATVDANGNVTAVAPGSADVSVRAIFKDGAAAPTGSDAISENAGSAAAANLYTASVAVTVVQPLESATVQGEIALDFLANETAALEVSIQPADATKVTISYASSDEAVATVDENGLVTPVGEGKAVIITHVMGDGLPGTGSIEDDENDASAGSTGNTMGNGVPGVGGAAPQNVIELSTVVTVAMLPQGVGLEQSEGLLYVGGSWQLEPYSLPEEAPESSYSYQSSDEAVATVDENGSVKAVGVGEATITVTSAEGHTAEYALTVNRARQAGGGAAGGASGVAAGVVKAGSGEGSGGGAPADTCFLCGVAWYPEHNGRCPVAIELYNSGQTSIDNGDGTFTPIAWLVYCDNCRMFDHPTASCPYRFYCETCGARSHTTENCDYVPYVCEFCGAGDANSHAATCEYAPCPVCGIRNWGVNNRHRESCIYEGYYTGPDSLVLPE